MVHSVGVDFGGTLPINLQPIHSLSNYFFAALGLDLTSLYTGCQLGPVFSPFAYLTELIPY